MMAESSNQSPRVPFGESQITITKLRIAECQLYSALMENTELKSQILALLSINEQLADRLREIQTLVGSVQKFVDDAVTEAR
jgi:hypothetical protein